MDLTARQKSLILTAKSTAAGINDLAKREDAARTAPITGTAQGYDPITGDWLISTPDGGTVRAQSMTNGALIGKRLPVQRFADSQSTAVNAPPSDGDNGWIAAELEAQQRDSQQRLGTDTLSGGVAVPTVRKYTLILRNDARRRIEDLELTWRNDDDTLGTAGAAVLLIDGAALPSTNILEIGERLILDVTDAGEGSLYFTVLFRRI